LLCSNDFYGRILSDAGRKGCKALLKEIHFSAVPRLTSDKSKVSVADNPSSRYFGGSFLYSSHTVICIPLALPPAFSVLFFSPRNKPSFISVYPTSAGIRDNN
jgi:hypothetical protein